MLSGRDEPGCILGYYTLRAMALSQGDVPEATRKHIPRYPLVSASTVGSLTVVVDAFDEPGAGFYAAHGFVRLTDSLRLVLPMRLEGGKG
ncbi:MAG: hypothetical protein ACLPSF_11155 [Methylocella sp.]